MGDGKQNGAPSRREGAQEDDLQRLQTSCETTTSAATEVARLQEEPANGQGVSETEAAATLFNNFYSTICIVRPKELIMDVDEKFKPRVKEVKAADAANRPQEDAEPDISTMKWWEIAIAVACTFWGFRRTGNTQIQCVQTIDGGGGGMGETEDLEVWRGAASVDRTKWFSFLCQLLSHGDAFSMLSNRLLLVVWLEFFGPGLL
ncbi:hypothetical protein BDW71DRAFT_21782 [Aspergillus fruticulosus]